MSQNLQKAVAKRLELDYPLSVGGTRRDAYLSVLRQTGNTPAALIEPVLNKYEDWLLHVFFQINEGRQSGMAGPLPLTFSEIQSFISITATELTPWEVETIKDMDRSYVQEMYNQLHQESTGQNDNLS